MTRRDSSINAEKHLKTQCRLLGDEPIVARFMMEQLQFRGVADAADAATCLSSYDCSRYPEYSGPTFTEFLTLAWGAGLRLEHAGPAPWNSFVQAYAATQLRGPVEVQMVAADAGPELGQHRAAVDGCAL